MFLINSVHLFSFLKLYFLKSYFLIFLFFVPIVAFSQSINDTIKKIQHAIKNTEIADYHYKINKLKPYRL